MLGIKYIQELCRQIKEIHELYGRRSFVRYNVDLPVRFSHSGIGHACTLTNVSRLGALMCTEQILPLGDELTLHLDLPGEEQLVQVSATVAHVGLAEEAAKQETEIGLDLVRMKPDEEVRWLNYIAALAGQV